MKLRTLSLVALILFVGMTSVSTAGMRQQRRRSGAGLEAVQPTDSEVIDLWYMRQEEKLARDVYLALSEKWDADVFANISESEQRHMDSIERLIDIYNLEDPVEGLGIGEFADQAFVDLYNELTELGSKSLTDAFSVGITIEELDIEDLNEKIGNVTTRNIERVFENLLAGSENHLAAFEYNIDNYDPDSPETCINDGRQRQGRDRPARDGQGMHGQRRNGQGRNSQAMNGQGRNRQGRNSHGRHGQGRNRQGSNGQGRNSKECVCDGTCVNQ